MAPRGAPYRERIDERRKRIQRRRESVKKDRKTMNGRWTAMPTILPAPKCLIHRAKDSTASGKKNTHTEQWGGHLQHIGVRNGTKGKMHSALALCVIKWH